MEPSCQDIIDAELGEELKDSYGARSMAHIHAELKMGGEWKCELNYAEQAYWRLQELTQQAREWVATLAQHG